MREELDKPHKTSIGDSEVKKTVAKVHQYLNSVLSDGTRVAVPPSVNLDESLLCLQGSWKVNGSS